MRAFIGARILSLLQIIRGIIFEDYKWPDYNLCYTFLWPLMASYRGLVSRRHRACTLRESPWQGSMPKGLGIGLLRGHYASGRPTRARVAISRPRRP
jgi:hypothetical protein